MGFLLDTNTCSRYLRGDQRIVREFRIHRGEISLSAITLGELLTWAYRKSSRTRLRTGIEELMTVCPVHPVDAAVADRFGELRARFLDQGRPTPELDLLIAATALVHNLTLVTHNTKDFQHVPGLSLDDWLP